MPMADTLCTRRGGVLFKSLTNISALLQWTYISKVEKLEM